MDLRLAGKRVLITGGSKGIGIACARVFLEEGCSVVLVARDAALPANVDTVLDSAARQAVGTAIAAADFDGKAGSSLNLRGIGPYAMIHVIGVGDGSERHALRDAMGNVAQKLMSEAHPVMIVGAGDGAALADAALGYGLGQYRFDKYKTGRDDVPADAVTFVGANSAEAASAWTNRHAAIVEGSRFARDLINEPANIIFPQSFVSETQKAFAGIPGVTIEVLDEAAMRKLNMGAILSVGQGSTRPPRMMIIRYRGPGSPDAPLALVGKGITFDTGGISIKPGAGMWNMRADMSGAAAVTGATLALARSQAPVHVVAVAALAENAVDAAATRPGDVVRSYSGKTIEVLNTDAEGRMVLADGIAYVQDRYQPRAIVDIATLTGAVVGALGSDYAGMFVRGDALGAAVEAAAETTGEAVWPMPLHPNYGKAMTSDIADLRNINPSGGAGAGLGAHFIGSFVAEGTPWVHLDIAGTNRSDSASALSPKGATGYGVMLLEELARNLP